MKPPDQGSRSVSGHHGAPRTTIWDGFHHSVGLRRSSPQEVHFQSCCWKRDVYIVASLARSEEVKQAGVGFHFMSYIFQAVLQ